MVLPIRCHVGAALSASLLIYCLGSPVCASDEERPQTRIAAIRTDTLTARRDRAQSDEIWWLAQRVPVAAPDASGDLILALFEPSIPETVEDEVAKTHGLEIVSRKMLPGLGMRMVRFRVPDARSVTEVVANLLEDKRVTSAQPNFHYRLFGEASSPSSKPDPRAGRNKNRTAAGRPGDGKTSIRLSVRRARSLVVGNHGSLQFPTADEPFVKVGTRSQ